jgi:hypothetical protein
VVNAKLTCTEDTDDFFLTSSLSSGHVGRKWNIWAFGLVRCSFVLITDALHKATAIVGIDILVNAAERYRLGRH